LSIHSLRILAKKSYLLCGSRYIQNKMNDTHQFHEPPPPTASRA